MSTSQGRDTTGASSSLHVGQGQQLSVAQMNNIIEQLLQNKIAQQNGEGTSLLNNMWTEQRNQISSLTDEHWKSPEMPLARIKKIMKMDEEVKMISGEVPVLLNRAIMMFISELTLRAWMQTEDSKRRTVQRGDIALAITKCDMFDFLIDIVPREEILFKINKRQAATGNVTTKPTVNMFQSLSVEQLQTCLQMAIQQLINSNSGTVATSDADAVPQQQEIEHLTAADIHRTVTNLSTEQMQQLMQLQQQQASLSVLNQPNDGHELQHLQTLHTVDTDSLLNQQEVVTTIDYNVTAPSDHLVPPQASVPSVTTQLSHQGTGDLVQQLERFQQQQQSQQQHRGLNMLHSLTDVPTSSPHDM
ncbi:nuclear transcription factor Y subunit gamma-like isoform X2 [Dysidea avara]|uniref:nuclear transcription factor Y subunit gamma-like isoform X2 n=1 Tax=Dysidea avara TaxID=196820 RepID=UPI003324F78E